MINPDFAPNDSAEGKGPKEVLCKESCLSYPGIAKDVWCFDSIDISYIDENGDGQCETFNGFEARIAQHEYRHLVGQCPLGNLTQ
jgi:peptide deformylase